jgi:hypothetical protein
LSSPPREAGDIFAAFGKNYVSIYHSAESMSVFYKSRILLSLSTERRRRNMKGSFSSACPPRYWIDADRGRGGDAGARIRHGT